MIYIYFLGEYLEDTFVMPSLDKSMKVKRSYNVYTGEKIGFKQKGRSVTLNGVCPVKDDLTVIAVELNRNVYPESR